MKGYSENEKRMTGTASRIKCTSGRTNDLSNASQTSDTMIETTVSTANRWKDAWSVVYIVSPRFLSDVEVWRKIRTNVANSPPTHIRYKDPQNMSCFGASPKAFA